MKKFVYIFVCLVAASIFSASAKAQVAIIANNSVKESAVSKSEIGDVFLGASNNLKSGSHVVPILLKAGPAHEEFLIIFARRSDTGLRNAWKTLVMSGQGTMPRSVDSEAQMVEYVSKTPGAIGYILKSTPHDGVKTLAVQ